jgi:hypothetical protein
MPRTPRDPSPRRRAPRARPSLHTDQAPPAEHTAPAKQAARTDPATQAHHTKPTSPALTPIDPASPPTTPAELRALLRDSLGLHMPGAPMIASHATPFDYLAHAFLCDFAPQPPAPLDCVVWANRGGGKTFLGALATALDLLFKPGVEVRILAGSLEQARRMHAHLKRLFDPRRDSPLALAANARITDRRITLPNGSEAEILAQSHTSVRGTRPQILRCDEADLFKPDVWEAAQLTPRTALCGPATVRGRIECFSTMQNPHGLMHRLIDECRAGNRRLFRWGLLDVLEHCGPAHACHAPDSHDNSNTPTIPDTPQAPGAINAPTPNQPTPQLAIPLPQNSPLPQPAASPSNPAPSATPPLSAPPTHLAHCTLWDECRGRAKRTPPPGGHITIDDAAAHKRRVCAATWSAEMLSRRPRRTDSVFPEFDPARHVNEWSLTRGLLSSPAEPPASVVSFLCGMDFGFREPTAILWAVLDEHDRLTILDEHVEAGQLIEEHAARLLAGNAAHNTQRGLPPWPRPDWIGADPAGKQVNDHTGDSSALMLRRAGLIVKSSSHRIGTGLSLIRARLRPADGAPPRLRIHSRCANLVRAMECLHYPHDKPDRFVPVKDGHDHPADALRYLIQNLDKPTTLKQIQA